MGLLILIMGLRNGIISQTKLFYHNFNRLTRGKQNKILTLFNY